MTPTIPPAAGSALRVIDGHWFVEGVEILHEMTECPVCLRRTAVPAKLVDGTDGDELEAFLEGAYAEHERSCVIVAA